MALLFAVWILQDFAQLLMMGICIVPDAFMQLTLLFALLPGTQRERQTHLVWAAFIGGLLWDLRWTNLPGLSAAVGSGLVAAACLIWQKIPVQGRGVSAFAMLSVVCELIYAFAHFIFWTIPSITAIRLFTVQQLTALPVIVLMSWAFYKVTERNG